VHLKDIAKVESYCLYMKKIYNFKYLYLNIYHWEETECPIMKLGKDQEKKLFKEKARDNRLINRHE
jgi:hypothetical protein